jgi:hypothetical protein
MLWVGPGTNGWRREHAASHSVHSRESGNPESDNARICDVLLWVPAYAGTNRRELPVPAQAGIQRATSSKICDVCPGSRRTGECGVRSEPLHSVHPGDDGNPESDIQQFFDIVLRVPAYAGTRDERESVEHATSRREKSPTPSGPRIGTCRRTYRDASSRAPASGRNPLTTNPLQKIQHGSAGESAGRIQSR